MCGTPQSRYREVIFREQCGFGHSRHGEDLSRFRFVEYTRIKHVMSFPG
jgi:hypothetical protein